MIRERVDGSLVDTRVRVPAIAGTVAAEQVRVLQANGIDEFHFYTRNRPDLTYTIAHVLGVRPRFVARWVRCRKRLDDSEIVVANTGAVQPWRHFHSRSASSGAGLSASGPREPSSQPSKSFASRSTTPPLPERLEANA